MDAHVCSAAHVDFMPDASVDLVIANGLLCCMTDHAGALNQMKRIARPAGRVYLRVSKPLRKGDACAVSKEGWARMLEGFVVLERGQSLTDRWVLVSICESSLWWSFYYTCRVEPEGCRFSTVVIETKVSNRPTVAAPVLPWATGWLATWLLPVLALEQVQVLLSELESVCAP